MNNTINVPKDSIIVFIGAMGTGKSTYASKTFAKHNVVSSDFIREQLSGDFEDQTYNDATFEILYATIEARAKAGIFTVVDSTGSRSLLDRVAAIARMYNRPLYAVKFPHLHENELTAERMQHRMKYLHAYHRQVKRIDETRIPSLYKVIEFKKGEAFPAIQVGESDEYLINPQFKYVIIPDLHGEDHVVDLVTNMLEADPELRAIFLGDLVDRGNSSYHTFRKVYRLMKMGKAFAVRSNHDNKLMRYFKKWLADDKPEKFYEPSEFDPVPAYGMKVAHGMESTLREFYSLDSRSMEDYAKDFIDYYENLASPYLKLEKNGEVHYFSHAGVTETIVKGQSIGKADESVCLYGPFGLQEKTHEEFVDYVHHICESLDPELVVNVHVGHYYMQDEPKAAISEKNPNRRMIFHDIGHGKRRGVYESKYITV